MFPVGAGQCVQGVQGVQGVEVVAGMLCVVPLTAVSCMLCSTQS